MSALSFERVAFVAGGRRLLDDVSFALEPGERLAIVGANGEGKTVIARLAAGLLAPTAGRVSVLGASWSDAARPADLRRRVGVVLQQAALLSDHTVAENVRFGLGRAAPGQERRTRLRVDRALTEMGVDHLADEELPELSHGERRRADLARMFLTDPELMILDDVFDGVDDDAADDLERRVARTLARRRPALLLLSHHVSRAAALAERVLRLEQGRLIPA